MRKDEDWCEAGPVGSDSRKESEYFRGINQDFDGIGKEKRLNQSWP